MGKKQIMKSTILYLIAIIIIIVIILSVYHYYGSDKQKDNLSTGQIYSSSEKYPSKKKCEDIDYKSINDVVNTLNVDSNDAIQTIKKFNLTYDKIQKEIKQYNDEFYHIISYIKIDKELQHHFDDFTYMVTSINNMLNEPSVENIQAANNVYNRYSFTYKFMKNLSHYLNDLKYSFHLASSNVRNYNYHYEHGPSMIAKLDHLTDILHHIINTNIPNIHSLLINLGCLLHKK